MKLSIRGIPTDYVNSIRGGGLDANRQPAVSRVAAGGANPCRHCLQLIADGDDKLVLAYTPFNSPQPYAETGPIFLHAKDCLLYESGELPAWFPYLQPAIIRGYGYDNWIKYETGEIVPGQALRSTSEKILADETIAYVHIRSKFNCFQCRVDRA